MLEYQQSRDLRLHSAPQPRSQKELILQISLDFIHLYPHSDAIDAPSLFPHNEHPPRDGTGDTRQSTATPSSPAVYPLRRFPRPNEIPHRIFVYRWYVAPLPSLAPCAFNVSPRPIRFTLPPRPHNGNPSLVTLVRKLLHVPQRVSPITSPPIFMLGTSLKPDPPHNTTTTNPVLEPMPTNTHTNIRDFVRRETTYATRRPESSREHQ